MRDMTLYIKDILDAMNSIENFIVGMDFQAFKKDDKTSSAVIRKLEIIGEASEKVPEKIRTQSNQIPWKEMAGMRDRLIHFYFGVNLRLVWNAITEEIPKAKPHLQKILSQLTEQNSES